MMDRVTGATLAPLPRMGYLPRMATKRRPPGGTLGPSTQEERALTRALWDLNKAVPGVTMDVANALDCHYGSVRKWMAGERTAPEEVREVLLTLIAERQAELERIAATLR